MFAPTETRVGPPSKGKKQSLRHLGDRISEAAFLAQNRLESGGKAGKSAMAAFNLVRFTIQTLPSAAIAGAIGAYMAGNISEDTMKILGEHCTDSTLSICDEAHLFERLSDKDKLLLSALLDTSADPNERKALSAIGVASAKTGVDFLFMLGFAHLESSIGKLQNAETSSAQGIFQYVEATWLESFKRFAPQYSSEYQYLADKIRIVNGEPTVTGDGIRHKILTLRIDDPDLHSFITARDMIRANDIVLAENWSDAPTQSAKTLLDIAQTLNMGRTAQLVLDIWQGVQNAMARPVSEAERNRMIEHKQDQLIEVITDAYFEHFLGATGKQRFMDLYNNKNARERYRPVAELIGHSKQPVSQRAISANGNIFMHGDASVVDAYEIVKARVEQAFTNFDIRVERYLERQLNQIQIVVDNKTILSVENTTRAATQTTPTSATAFAQTSHIGNGAVDAIGALITQNIQEVSLPKYVPIPPKRPVGL